MPAVIAVIMALAGYAVGNKVGSQGNASAKEEGYRAGLAAAKTKVDAAGSFQAPHLTSLRGTVTNVGADSLDINVEQTVTNPLAEQAPLVRHVTLAKDAVIMRTTQKSDAATFKDLADYEKAVKAARDAGKQPPEAPLSYTFVKISLGDIKTGDIVVVESTSDIAMAGSFVATSVRVETQTAAAAPPATPTASTPPETAPATGTAPAPGATPPTTNDAPPKAPTPPPAQTPPPSP